MKVFVIAGEPSGDALGAALMDGLATLGQQVDYQGIGGPLMQAQGLTSQFPMSELSLMGIAEILPKYMHLKRRIRETVDAVLAAQPDVLLTIDSPDFCLRVAKAVKAQSTIRTVHYVAPTVWAWRPKRAAKMAGVIDHVLALFPFEPPLMQAEGMGCDFVGHPVVAQPVATPEQVQSFRASLNLSPDAPLVLALPGSRRSEVSRLAPIFGQACRDILDAHPNAQVIVPAAPSVAALVQEVTQTWSAPVCVVDSADAAMKRAAFGAADVALAASGTVSLELAAADTPMVIAYDMNWISRQIIGRMLLVDTVTLVNLVSETRAVPEYIGPDCQPAQISAAALRVLADPTAQHDAMAKTMKALGRGGQAPGVRAAQALLNAV
ncbi:lipid-A-disaccharide synthase [Nereida sp. MMG025]|uniref:lipid-A-disaccharide synthase n=1 Tax=Nereida sp. MMG025 TaxID=2909981 RepID=UPI001F016718|nr:lipid-A-disaccharide synthase [Nereida sp. MMG025]MCF6443226.1 lipid-A-disaccharide synthase [Nereida sp. MMG025]